MRAEYEPQDKILYLHVEANCRVGIGELSKPLRIALGNLESKFLISGALELESEEIYRLS